MKQTRKYMTSRLWNCGRNCHKNFIATTVWIGNPLPRRAQGQWAGDAVIHGSGPFWVGQGGVWLVITAALGRLVLGRWNVSLPSPANATRPLLAVVGLSVLAELILTTWYLFVPGYMDHIEASVASDVHYFRAGLPLYPPVDSYTFHGLLYGPLLVEMNSLGYQIASGAVASKVVGWLAAWIAIGVIIVAVRPRKAGWEFLVGIAYALCLLVSFGGELTTDRSESLLLLSAALALVVARSYPGFTGILLLGLLCGAASAFKLHGPLYCAPALYLWVARYPRELWRRDCIALSAVFAISAAVASLLPFAPANVSLSEYREYLALALRHGANLELFLLNSAFLLGIWSPILLLPSRMSDIWRMPQQTVQFALVLFAAECLVVVVASKPGAGVHHLIPFLAAQAYLFEQIYAGCRNLESAGSDSGTRASVAMAVVIIAMVCPTVHAHGELLQFNRRAGEQALQRNELLELSADYPHGMLGVTGAESYSLVNLRPWLTLHGTLQTDYGAYMDLRLSGVDDKPLQNAFARCDIPFVYMPKQGAPFTLSSSYGGPLFSDEHRSRFTASYSRAVEGVYFNVFACNRGLHVSRPRGGPSAMASPYVSTLRGESETPPK